MTFEEFFNKKRIDLVALQAAEPGLYAEFEKHFAQMGEKSFDHTKKYWFNKLRLLYHLAPGLKPEKMHQENQLAEQTVVETLTDTIPTPAAGFKPRFKSGMATAKPAEPTTPNSDTAPVANTTPPQVKAASEENTAPKPAFKPRFKPGMGTAKPTEPTSDAEPVEEAKQLAATETPVEVTAPKPAFKPRFNMKTMAVKPAEEAEDKPAEAEPPIAEATTADDVKTEPAPEATASKPGFKPRFNMKTMAPKPAEQTVDKPAEIEPPVAEAMSADEVKAEPAPEATAPKPGFKPRFNMKTMALKPAEETEDKAAEIEPPVVEAMSADDVKNEPAEEKPAAPKVGFKPRFNANTIKPQSPPQE